MSRPKTCGVGQLFGFFIWSVMMWNTDESRADGGLCVGMRVMISNGQDYSSCLWPLIESTFWWQHTHDIISLDEVCILSFISQA